MGKRFVIFGCVAACIFVFNIAKIHAADEAATASEWKQKLTSDQQAIKEQRDQIKDNSQESRSEEKQLRDQIKSAMDSGDMETARKLKAQLKATHQENVQQMIQDKKEVKADMQDLKNDVQQAKQGGILPPPRRDRDNNPPGPRGGAGTNWENPPGPQGGPGASPDRKPRMGGGHR